MVNPGLPEDKKRIWIASLLVALATVLVYFPCLNNGFVNWDDPRYVYENPYIRSLDSRFFGWMFTSFYASFWHPLTLLSHALDYSLWGSNPWGHHLTSILLHGLNTFLVVILVIRLLEYARVRREISLSGETLRGKPVIAGVITGLLFGLHPLHVESVAWVSERKDVLCAFFFLLSLLCYLGYVSSQQRRFKFYGLCLFFFIVALMSKPMAVTLPVVLLILDIYPLGRLDLKSAFSSQRKVWSEKLPFLGLSVASSIVAVVAQQVGGALAPLDYLPPGFRILGSIRALCFYLVKMVWPNGLVPFYPHPLKVSLSDPQYMIPLVVLIDITALCIWLWPRQRIWSAAWAYYVVTLLPVLGIIQVGSHAAADRYTYLPSLGPFLLAGLGLARAWEKIGRSMHRKLFIMIPSILLVTLLANLTVEQIKVWNNSITLWSHELKQFPDDAPWVYGARGIEYADLGNYQRAIKDFDRAIELDPEDAKTYCNRGLAYASLGNHRRAIEDYNKGIEVDSQYAQTYLNRGALYGQLGNYQKAIKDFGTAIELDPQFAQAYSNRGLAYQRLGRYQPAIEDFDKAIGLEPQNVKAYVRRGHTYAAKGEYEKAISDYEQVLKIDPDNVQACSNLGCLYIDKEIDLEQGLRLIKKALSITPENPAIVAGLGRAYYRKGMFDEALEELERAIKLGGDDAQLHEHLAKVYEKKERYEEAVKAWKKVQEIAPQHREAQESLTRLSTLIRK